MTVSPARWLGEPVVARLDPGTVDPRVLADEIACFGLDVGMVVLAVRGAAQAPRPVQDPDGVEDLCRALDSAKDNDVPSLPGHLHIIEREERRKRRRA